MATTCTDSENMEICGYPCLEQDSNSVVNHFGHHSHQDLPIAPGQDMDPFVHSNGSFHLDSETAAMASTEKPMEKCKVRKRRLTSDNGELLDGEAMNEKQSVMRWKDVWVAQLIHTKVRLQAAALSGPQKQRVDVWQAIKTEMARTCGGFDKDSEACRKKWRRVYKEYKDDKCLRVAGGDASQRCKFYDLMDFYMGARTSGADDSQLTAVAYMGPVKNECVMIHNGEAVGMDSAVISADHPASERHDASQESSAMFGVPAVDATKRPYRRVKGQGSSLISAGSAGLPSSVPSLLSELVGLGKEMLQMTRQYEQGKIDALHVMREMLREISKEI